MEDNVIISMIAPISLAVIMAGMGMTLTTGDFKRVVLYPKAVAIGTFMQMICLPLVGFLVALLFNLSPAIAVGIVLIAACPGGITSNIISHLSKGDTALSITLTVISSFLTVITIPLIVNLALQYFMNISTEEKMPVLQTSIQVFVITVLPILVGMVIKQKAPGFAKKSVRFVNTFSLLFLIFLLVLVVIQEWESVNEHFMRIGPACIVLCLVTALLGFFSSRLIKLNVRQSISITVEVGIQNSTMAAVLAISILSNTQFAIPPVIYTVVMMTAAGLLIAYMNLSERGKTFDSIQTEQVYEK
jgi:BASS family bile acid:Na+ symporter